MLKKLTSYRYRYKSKRISLGIVLLTFERIINTTRCPSKRSSDLMFKIFQNGKFGRSDWSISSSSRSSTRTTGQGRTRRSMFGPSLCCSSKVLFKYCRNVRMRQRTVRFEPNPNQTGSKPNRAQTKHSDVNTQPIQIHHGNFRVGYQHVTSLQILEIF